MSETPTWYVVKVKAGNCEILSAEELSSVSSVEQWGPFPSKGEAIARRVGLIRAGKCTPV